MKSTQDDDMFCKKCGAYIPSGYERCVACGSYLCEISGREPLTDCKSCESEAIDLTPLANGPKKVRLYDEEYDGVYISSIRKAYTEGAGRTIDGSFSRGTIAKIDFTIVGNFNHLNGGQR